jgi:hypothetical protein
MGWPEGGKRGSKMGHFVLIVGGGKWGKNGVGWTVGWTTGWTISTSNDPFNGKKEGKKRHFCGESPPFNSKIKPLNEGVKLGVKCGVNQRIKGI